MIDTDARPRLIRRPARALLIVSVIVVGLGFVFTLIEVGHGIAESEISYHGRLDAKEIRESFSPGQPAGGVAGYAYLDRAEGDMLVPRARGAALAAWSVADLAPSLLALGVLLLVAPILRAAERGEPFAPRSVTRLSRAGVLLFFGVPGVAVAQYVAAEVGTASEWASPGVEPWLEISLLQFLPGLLVLMLAEVFRRGIELRELERHTI